MRNFRDSDYAANKFAEGIVYRFQGQRVEITLADYLAENSDKTAQDFYDLKRLSDEIYLRQDRADYAQTKKNVSIHGMEDGSNFTAPSLEEQYIERLDKRYSLQAVHQLLQGNMLTTTQKRRFRLYIFDGLSLRQIANLEGTSHLPVYRSINASICKLKKLFYLQG